MNQATNIAKITRVAIDLMTFPSVVVVPPPVLVPGSVVVPPEVVKQAVHF
jgi:hypothetical protein